MKKIMSLILMLTLIITLGIGCSKGKDTNTGNQDIKNNKENIEEEIEDNSKDENTEEVNEIQYVIYLKSKSGPILSTESRFIKENDERLENRTIEEIALEDLINFREIENLKSPVPEGTKVLGITKDESTVIVDLSKEFVENMGSTTTDTKLAVAAIVNTLTILEENDKVVFKIEGEKVDSINGINMDKEFEYNIEFFPDK